MEWNRFGGMLSWLHEEMDAITFHFQLRQLSGSIISDTHLYIRQQTSKFKTDFLPRYMLWLVNAYELLVVCASIVELYMVGR